MWIQAAKEALYKFTPQTGLEHTNESPIGLLELVLTKNNFQFNNQHYLQINWCHGNQSSSRFCHLSVFNWTILPHKVLRHLGKNPIANTNACPHQLQGSTIGLHFAQANHKSTSNFQLQILEFIPLPPNSERGLNLRLTKEKFWIHRHRWSVTQGLNIVE